MSLRKAAAVARAAAKTQLSSDEDEGSDGWDGCEGSKPKVKTGTRGRTSEGGSSQKKRGRPRALTVGSSGTRPDSPQPTPKARKSLDSPRKVKGTKRPQHSTPSGLDSDLSELSSLEDPASPTHQPISPTLFRSIPEQANGSPPGTGRTISKHKPPPSSMSSRPLASSASFTLGAPPKTPADTSRVRNILSGVLGSGKSVLGRTTSSPSISFSSPTISFSREMWERDKLGSCVWVLVDRSGHPVERRGKGEAYWWPAEVVSQRGVIPIDVKFFGRICDAAPPKCSLWTPSGVVIWPMLLPSGGMRFTSTNYTLTTDDSADLDFSAPAKRPRTDLDDRWKVATDEMIRTDAERNDGFVPRLTSLQSGMAYERLKDPDEVTTDDDLSDEEAAEIHHPPTSFIDPGPDPMLNIPGERVLARVNNSRTEYWPAVITDYVPSTAPRRRGKYSIMFFDKVKKNVNRALFYTSLDDGFSTCKLGEIRYCVPVDDGRDESDDEEMEDVDRSPSPIPSTSLRDCGEFRGLDLHQQLGYTKEVLQAVLNNSYPPVQSRHERFMKGGKERATLDKDASLKGVMTSKEVSKLTKLLIRWVLRDLVKAEQMAEDCEVTTEPDVHTDPDFPSEPPPSSFTGSVDLSRDSEELEEIPTHAASTARPPPLRGCPAYENLTVREKLDYCTNILVPEAILQILLWRSGDRGSTAVCSVEEEERLHHIGSVLTQQSSDWIGDLLRQRDVLGGRGKLKMGKGEDEGPKPISMVEGGTRLRRKIR
ncbi:hypothetical protein BDM02DRAFT_3122124 [Thelephora ganbajun]|uniref:Uncharacterized protein n=1 Tax=Thelephora ganbajun TaxID=370292 RepID=A0ACB6Z564_THEGA|nr:hypothetical protein BDM02DRAFT_3122124 [Thelephora ganbajun]